jgi:hypothetical protein
MTAIGLTNRYQLFTPEHMLLDETSITGPPTPSAIWN